MARRHPARGHFPLQPHLTTHQTHHHQNSNSSKTSTTTSAMGFFSPSSLVTFLQRRTLSKLLLLTILCSLSYLLSLHLHSPSETPNNDDNCSTTPTLTVLHTSSSVSSPPLDFHPHHLLPLPFCPSNFTDYCPCHDPLRERRFHAPNLLHRERHCPTPSDRPPLCRVPRPPGYRSPFPWPRSRDRAWFANVPSTRLSQAKKDQHWVRVEGDTLVFPGGGTTFPDGVAGYVHRIASLVPLRTGEVRTALDIGCGVASFGGCLLDYDILTLSVAPRDVHEAQVQFALERGLPAMLGILSVHKLPYPSRSFDMAHCARCLIQWSGYGGLYLLEIDRVIRPGGYWVLSGPPINWRKLYKGWHKSRQEVESEKKAIEDLAKQLCWKKVGEKGPFAVWRKPSNHLYCRKKAKVLTSLPFCEATYLDAAWYEAMHTCISPLPDVQTAEDVAGGAVERWPKRLNALPPRIMRGDIEGITSESFNSDNVRWNQRLTHYEKYIHLSHDRKYRNIMDMNAYLGGFAAALVKSPVWVMNVVPAGMKNDTLGIIYERGLIGTYMDWCEAFSTYPRTYDFLHADGIFSLYAGRCDAMDILLEMDRVLRPEGAAIIRDHVDVVLEVRRAADELGWHSRMVQGENGPLDPENLLIVDNSISTKDAAQ